MIGLFSPRSHSADESTYEENPVQLDGNPRVSEPCLVARALQVCVASKFPLSHDLCLSFSPHHLKCIRLGKPPAKGDNEDRRLSSKPEKRPPAVGSSRNKLRSVSGY